MIRKPLVIVGVLSLTLAGLGLFGIGSGTAPYASDSSYQSGDNSSTPMASAEAPEKNREVLRLYSKYCRTCHGRDGKGTEWRETVPTMPDFTSRKWHKGITDVELLVSILEGKGTLMPGFRERLTDEQADAMVKYVREFAFPPKNKMSGE